MNNGQRSTFNVSQSSESEIDQKLSFWGDQIEAQFEHFPILKDICKGLKKSQYPAAVFVGACSS